MSQFIQASCNLYNTEKAGVKVHLKTGQYLALTYGGNLRFGTSGEDPFVEINCPPEKVLISPEYMGHKLYLNMTHGRKDPKEEMNDFGFSHSDTEGYTGPPRGDAILFVEDVGAKVITYKADGSWDTLLVPYVEDLLFFEGNYYGDYSADNDGKVL